MMCSVLVIGEQGEDDIGVPDIGGEQHLMRSFLGYVPGANDTFAAIRQAQAQRAIGFFKPGKGAGQHGSVGVMHW